jgi:hypothetical protein
MFTKNLRFFGQTLHTQWPVQTSKKPQKSLLENGGCNNVVDVAEYTEFEENCPSSNIANTPAKM